jgi:hypothetical protein
MENTPRAQPNRTAKTPDDDEQQEQKPSASTEASKSADKGDPLPAKSPSERSPKQENL